MTSLTAIFGSSRDPGEEEGPESEKLLNLYWNRAELKKEFASLRAETVELRERLKQQEGVTARVEQKLSHLENLLLDPEWVYNVVTHFQLRALYERCSRRLSRFAEELKQQREKKQHGQLLAEWNEQRELEAQAIESEIGAHRLELHRLEDRLRADRHRLATMNGIVRLFRGRGLMSALDELSVSIESARAREQALLERLDEARNRPPPDAQGLDIATKRMINFTILAFAQQLYLHLRRGDLANLVKDAGDRSVGAINFGDKSACDEILATVAARRADLDQVGNIADVLKRRARMIAQKALFRQADDAVPRPESVATVFDFDPAGRVREESRDLLGANYWGILDVVSR
ncbi:MAG: hypothetical protein R3315_00435 [Woeseiaceae bacterium]|nr:hypothetical protein [Woeseiaceae bacterium]